MLVWKKTSKKSKLNVLVSGLLASALVINVAAVQSTYKVSADPAVVTVSPGTPILDTPFMGWNSFDSFYDSADLNEENIKKVADFMAEHMKDSGYIYINLDGGWWNNAGGSGVVLIDEHGRPRPGEVRFPSAELDLDGDGKKDGLKHLADYIHSKGLKLGIYATRGIPRSANNSTVTIDPEAIEAVATTLGKDVSQLTGQQITNIADICAWSNDNYGLNWEIHPEEALAYYVSLFQLWEEWGVDFVKIDDLNDSSNAKYSAYPDNTPPYRQADIEGYAKAREIAGSDIVISGSPGRGLTGERVDNILSQLDSMRVSADVWDSWADVNKLFAPAKEYAQYTNDKPGKYIDLDMLPFGTLKDKTNNPFRASKLTRDEIITSMTLHLITRSPIIMGGVPYMLDIDNDMDKFTLDVLTNKEALAVNQEATNPKSFYDAGNITKWVSDAADGSKYIALFNRNGSTSEITFDFADPNIGLEAAETYNVKDLWAGEYVGSFNGTYSVSVPGHGAVLYKVIPASNEEAVPTVNIATPGMSVNAGETQAIMTTVTNNGSKEVTDATVTLELPNGWTAAPAVEGANTVAVIPVNESHNIEWQITVPETASVSDNVVITKVVFYEGETLYNKQVSSQMTVIPAVIPEGFYDGFEEGKASWSDAGAGTWIVVDESGNSVLKQTASTAGTSMTRGEYRTTVTDRTWMDAIYEVDLRYDGATRNNDLGNWSTLMFRKGAQDNSFRQETYFLYWRINGEVVLAKGPSGESLGSYNAPAFSSSATATSDWQHLKVANVGNRIQVFLNNDSTPVIDVVDSISPYKIGYAGMGANASAWSFDNFTVRVDGELLQEAGTYDQNVEKASEPSNAIHIPVVLLTSTAWNTYLIDSEGTITELGLNDGDDYEKETSGYVTTYHLTQDLLNSLEVGTYTIQLALSDGSKRDYSLTIMDSTVKEPEPEPISVEGITVTGSGAITSKGGTAQYTASVTPDNADNKEVQWSVENGTGQATMTATGLLTAVADGTVIVKATAKDGSGIVGQLTVTISGQSEQEPEPEPISVEGITVTGAETITSKGGTAQYTASVTPDNADNKEVQWSVENGTGQATMTATGLLIAVADGTVIVKATAKDGSGIVGQLTVTISGQSEQEPEPEPGDESAPTWEVDSKVTASNVTTSSVKLIWNTAVDDVAITGYKVTWKAGAVDKAKEVEGDATSTTISGLQSNTSYTFTVEAVDAAGNWSQDGPSVTVRTKKVYVPADPEPTPSVDPEQPSEPQQPSETEQPSEPEQPTGPELPSETDQPGNGEQPAEPAKVEFIDVPAAHWAQAAIQRAAALGIVQGNPDGTYKPNAATTRAEFMTMLAKAFKWQSDENEATELNFQDNDNIGAWAKDAIAEGLKRGIVTGYKDGSFRPDQEITRTEMIVMLARALGIEASAIEQTSFSDDENIPTWGKGAVEALREQGLLTGRSGNSFAPNDAATRAEALVIILRALNL